MLKKIVGFETIRVVGDYGGSAGAIINVRHPVYLLSKLANPYAQEDPKYLPLICCAAIWQEQTLFTGTTDAFR